MVMRLTDGARREKHEVSLFSSRAAALVSRVSRLRRSRALDCSLNLKEKTDGVAGRDEVWDQEAMFSQLAKRSPRVVVSG